VIFTPTNRESNCDFFLSKTILKLHNADLKNFGYRQKFAPNSWAGLTFHT